VVFRSGSGNYLFGLVNLSLWSLGAFSVTFHFGQCFGDGSFRSIVLGTFILDKCFVFGTNPQSLFGTRLRDIIPMASRYDFKIPTSIPLTSPLVFKFLWRPLWLQIPVIWCLTQNFRLVFKTLMTPKFPRLPVLASKFPQLPVYIPSFFVTYLPFLPSSHNHPERSKNGDVVCFSIKIPKISFKPISPLDEKKVALEGELGFWAKQVRR